MKERERMENMRVGDRHTEIERYIWSYGLNVNWSLCE